ncbi:MBL fold metallo-hydrolase [bacterium]|nr:MBL fold metallo-hydrolase [bacterium]
MKIKILGASKNVTGSKFLVETKNRRILIDCGLFQEREFKNRNWEEFPVEPESIDAVILTHAHLDHCGFLPKLVKDGFSGKIYCTEPTEEIAKIVLLDSAKLQVEDAEKKRKRHEKEGRRGPYPEIPLYDTEDAEKVFPLFSSVNYNSPVKIGENILINFYDAGHILGSSMVKLEISENGREKKLIFSGDIGRWNKPILSDPTVFKSADYVFMETTYGNRLHESKEEATEKFINIINKTVKRGGNIVIPTFAIERAQEILYYLNKFLNEDLIPHLIVFVDSPMAIDVTEVFKKHTEYFDEETRNLIKNGQSPFSFPMLKLTKSVHESKAINYIKGSSIIMAGSGMCTGGRIKHHLITNITRPESTILFVGYQAKGTLGREILEKKEKVRILGQFYPVKARIEKINGFSAHADRDELLKWICGFENLPEKIFLIHGEEEIIEEFKEILKEKVKSEIFIPSYLEEYTL